ncbi:hypothetical protein D3C76_1105150 [compost metagenome]
MQGHGQYVAVLRTLRFQLRGLAQEGHGLFGFAGTHQRQALGVLQQRSVGMCLEAKRHQCLGFLTAAVGFQPLHQGHQRRVEVRVALQ